MTEDAAAGAGAPAGSPDDTTLSGRTADAFAAVLLAVVALQTIGTVMLPVVAPFLAQAPPEPRSGGA